MQPAAVNTPSDTQVQVVRHFNAPVDVVWNAFTDIDSMRRWMLGPPGWSMPVCEMDFRVGGEYKNVFSSADGSEIAIVGDFREIETERKIVQDEKHVIRNAHGESGHETVVTFIFEESNRITTVTTVIEYPSSSARDEALATGMGDAMEMGYRRIDELIAD